MRLIKFLLIGLLIAATTVVTSCDKKHVIKNNLCSKEGDWNLERSFYKKTDHADSNFSYEIVQYNSAIYRFKRNGDLIQLFKNQSTNTEAIFTKKIKYWLTKDKLTFFDDHQYSLTKFDMNWEKDNLILSYTGSYKKFSNLITEVYILNLKKI